LKRPKIGDVVEIESKKGFSYAQYTHKHKQYGALLRVLPGFYKNQPDDFSEMVKICHRFYCFFPLGAAINRGIFKIAGNAAIPDKFREFPVFRAAGFIDPTTRKVDDWWLWDGEEEWRVGAITEEQRKMPIRGIWNDTILIERIESGWMPESNDW